MKKEFKDKLKNMGISNKDIKSLSRLFKEVDRKRETKTSAEQMKNKAINLVLQGAYDLSFIARDKVKRLQWKLEDAARKRRIVLIDPNDRKLFQILSDPGPSLGKQFPADGGISEDTRNLMIARVNRYQDLKKHPMGDDSEYDNYRYGDPVKVVRKSE